MSACFFVWYSFFFFKQKTAYEMRISDWSSDVCSSDLLSGEGMVAPVAALRRVAERQKEALVTAREVLQAQVAPGREAQWLARQVADRHLVVQCDLLLDEALVVEDVGDPRDRRLDRPLGAGRMRLADPRSEEHTSEL